MSESYRLLLAFLFILPATLAAKPDEHARATTIIEDIAKVANQKEVVAKEGFRGSFELHSETVYKDQDLSNSTLPDSISMERVKVEQ